VIRMSQPKINIELLRESLEITRWTGGAIDYIVQAVEEREDLIEKLKSQKEIVS
jgi:hypothetical protein